MGNPLRPGVLGYIWGFPEMGVPENGWFINTMENPIIIYYIKSMIWGFTNSLPWNYYVHR